MIGRRTAVSFALVLMVGAAVLAWLGTRPHWTRAASLEVPYSQAGATLAVGQTACESPVRSATGFGAVRAFAAALGPPSELQVLVRRADGAVVARGSGDVGPAFVAVTIRVAVGRGQSGSVCIVDRGPGSVALGGVDRRRSGLTLTVAGRPVAHAISLVLLAPTRRSLLALLPTAFARAAVFRFGFVGAWVFWLLSALLAASVVGLGVAAARAAGEDSAP